MNKLAEWMARLTLGRLLALLFVFSLVSALAVIVSVSHGVRDRTVRELAQNDAEQTTMLIFQGLYSGMRKGWGKREINEAIVRLKTTLPGSQIKVYRGRSVAQQFGDVSGEQDLIDKNPALKLAMTSGKNALLSPDDTNIRHVYPVLATRECLSCHAGTHAGAVLGVVDISYPTGNLQASFKHVINIILGCTMLVLGVVFIAMYFKLRHFIVMPVANMVDVMRRITKDKNLGHRIGGAGLIAELRLLSEYFNLLLGTIQKYNMQLEELSMHDPLTGLYNRRKFQECMQYEIARATRHEHGFSLIMVGLGNFKYINDTFGHPIGDMVLKELAAMLSAGLRKGDVLARMGGDEFAIILPETSAAKGLQVADKLHQTLADKIFELPVGKIRSTASFSMVNFPGDGKTEEQIHAAMNDALRKAKTHGKNQVMTPESDEDRSMMTVLKQGDFLRNALREDRVETFLQPIVDVRTLDVMACEVLVRIRDGEVTVPAGEFIEAAEELGMAQDLDREVFRKGLAQYAGMARKHPHAKMFFNLFPRSFNDLYWVCGIPEMVRAADVPCESIVLELTEREALPNLTQVRDVIEELRASRISVALDDFGSGFSSFLYLKYLEIDYVKIDGSFVRQITLDSRDRIMVEHINRMAHEFGLKTVAEFVEDEATAKMLAEIGVDYAQGYYYGHPARSE